MRGRDLLAPLGVGALAVICCADLPAVLTLAAGVTVVGLLGGVLLAVLAAGAGAFVLRARRRRGCAIASSHPRTGA